MTADPDARLERILEVLLDYAALRFDRRAALGDALDTVDAVASAVNMLGEELQATAVSKRELQAALEELGRTQAQLVHAGKLAAVGQLASAVAHEIANPAAVVVANRGTLGRHAGALAALAGELLELAREPGAERLRGALERHGLEGRVREMREILADDAEGLQRVCSVARDLRPFARADGDEEELVDPNAVVRRSCGLVRNLTRQKARLVLDLPAVPPVRGSAGRLGQVVTNLVVNALDAIPEGAPERHEVRVTTAERGAEVVIAVEDTGRGIAPELRERVFEPFFTTKPRERGTGLGLSLSAEIVRRHGGTIRFDGEPGVGTRFEVRLPAARGEAAVRAERSSRPSVLENGRARILIVDDEAALLRAYRRMLDPPHEVVLAEGGAQALARLGRDRAFDLVLVDLEMPEVDGPAVYHALSWTAPEVAARLVFATGGAFTDSVRRFVAALTNPVIEKPVERETIEGLLGR